MNYPKLKCEDKKNTKVCSLTSRKMKDMRKAKYTYQEIADKFKVSTTTVHDHISPTRNTVEWKEKIRKRSKQYNKQRYNNDPEFRRKMLDSINKYHKEKWHNDPKFKEWLSKLNIARTKRLQAKYPTWSYTCARGVHETTTNISRCKNSLGNCKCPCHSD